MTDDIFDSKPRDDRPRSVGLAAPRPLSSAELQEKYGRMNHAGVELMWPVRFEDEHGKSDLTDHDTVALARLSVTVEQYLEVELLCDEFDGLSITDALAVVRATS